MTNAKILKVPKIRDIEYLLKILKVLNCTYTLEKDELIIDTTNLKMHLFLKNYLNKCEHLTTLWVHF